MRWIVPALALALTGCFNSLVLTPAYTGGPIAEVLVRDSEHLLCRKKIALIDVEGLIANARTSSLLGGGDNPVTLFKERLDAAADDPKVKAVVLRINSPGGAVTASDIMYQDLCRFRAETGKPVVACFMDVAASGGYYLAMGCDRIYAHPTTVTGSIGVIMSLYNAHDLLAKVGVSSNAIKSGPNKDLGNPARPMTDAERAILQGMVDRFYGEFVQVVCKGRGLPEEQVRQLADGRIYSGKQAQELGLVDEVGYLDDAIECAKDLACIRDARVVAYDRGKGHRGCIYAKGPSIPSEITVKIDVPALNAWAGGQCGAAFLYLWEPGLR
jgi:protease-4